MTGKEKIKTMIVWGLAAVLVVGYCMSDTPNAAVFSCAAEISQAKEEELSQKYSAEWEEKDATLIACNGDTVSIDGDGIRFEDGILWIEEAGVYVISGELSDGQVCIDADKEEEIQLVLDGAKLHCANHAVIYAKQCKRLILTLADGTENFISDGEEYLFEEDEDEPNAAIFSKDDLIINGTGSLEVEGNYAHGIRSKDDLVLISGTILVTAVKDGVKGKDSVTAQNPTLTIVSGEDGLRTTNADEEDKGTIVLKGGIYTITAGQDGIQAETTLEILGGSYEITTGEGSGSAVNLENQIEFGKNMQQEHGDRTQMGEIPQIKDIETASTSNAQDIRKQKTQGSYGREQMGITSDMGAFMPEQTTESSDVSKKGIKAGTKLTISGGTFFLDTEDDAIHTNGDAKISGGTFEILSGDDGCHADGQLLITDGTIQIEKSYEGLEGSNVIISGGKISIISSDDGINAAGGNDESGMTGFLGRSFDSFNDSSAEYKITISGGEVTIDASGDGIDSNGNIEITGGTILVNGPVGGADSAIDYEREAKMTGGILIAAGTSSMAQGLAEDSETLSVMIYFNETQQAQTRISMVDEQGNLVCSFVPEKQYQNIIIASEKIESGKTYTLMRGGTVEGSEISFCEDGQLEGAEEMTTVTFDQNTKRISEDGTESSGFGGMMRGGFGRR